MLGMVDMWCALVLVLLVACGNVNGAALRPFMRKNNMGMWKELSGDALLFTQRVDHFDPLNTQTWSQRYTVNTTSYKPGGPTFIFLAGEAPMEFFGFQEVQAVNWAAEFGANCIFYMFYGESIPTKDFSTSNLKYLTSQQALADAANFVSWMQTQNGTNFQGKWVVFGCSYSGALSAWFRLKYPNLVVASVAPSGPVLAQLNFTGYFNQFQYSAAPDCVKATVQATQQITQLMLSNTGRQTLAKYFNACSEIINEEDDYFFLYSITGVLGSADQMNNPPDWGLNSTCSTLLASQNYAQNWGQIFMEDSGDNCTDFLNFFCNWFDRNNPSIEASQDGNRAWTYQTCVEFGYFSTTYPGTSVFFPTLDVEHQVKWCEEIYGIPGMTPNIAWTNAYYGGKNLTGTNIMFTNGDLDPWHLLSINEDFADGSVLAATYEAGHCGSMIAGTDIDPPSLVAARQRVGEFLAKALQ